MSNKDGISKNISVVKIEFKHWWAEMKATTRRFRYGGLVNKGRRSPSGDTNNNYFHLLTNYVSETYHNLPRTLTYITILVIVVSLLELVL